MKKMILFAGLIIFSHLLMAQVTSGVSQSGYVSITKDPPKPPYLEIVNGSLSFQDENDNGKIDANEKSVIYFQLKNTGMGPGLNLKVSVTEKNGIGGLQINDGNYIGKLNINEERQVQVPVYAGMGLPNGRALFQIKVDEANGFDSDPVEIEIETKAFKAPLVKVVDYKVTSESSNTLQRRKPFDVQVLIQNIGEGNAKNVKVSFSVPDNMYCLSANENQMIGNLEPGEEYLINYTLVTTNEYNASSIVLNMHLSEVYGKYAENNTITMTMNQGISSEKLLVQGKTEQKKAITIGSLSSKVDKNIPNNPTKNPNRIALVIGNEDYSRNLNAEVNVAYAKNDAEIFRRYALDILGVEEKNMHFMVNAKKHGRVSWERKNRRKDLSF